VVLIRLEEIGVLLKWLQALSVGGITAILLVMLNTLSPASDAASEEEIIFNADNASTFGEDPQPRRKLQLLALGSDEGGAFAQLSVDGEVQQWRAGDTILGCVMLAKILEDSVLINNCGGYALLAPRLTSTGGSFALNAEQYEASNLAEPHIVDLRSNLAVRRLIADYRQRLYQRPLSLRGVVDVDVRVDPLGERRYYLSPGKDQALFATLPLRAGDRVIAINGLTLASGEGLTDIYGVLANIEQLALTLERGEQRVVLLLRF
jgi:general secretion pathway protein C